MRRWIIEQSLASGVGHIASALSITDICAVLWTEIMKDPGTPAPDRDRFILGKGHAALALYSAMRWKGLISPEAFATYCKDGSLLGAHPGHELPGVEMSTGSLGQGISVGCGIALGLRVKKSPGRVYVLISDGECNEGQVWEAALFAGHHRLGHLTAVMDLNGLQCMGYTKDVLDTGPMADKWRAFKWDVVEVDGHDHGALKAALSAPVSMTGKPRMIVARTKQGRGVPFMEDQLEWHYRNLTPELAKQALDVLPPP